jgi:hypothetical protein
MDRVNDERIPGVHFDDTEWYEGGRQEERRPEVQPLRIDPRTGAVLGDDEEPSPPPASAEKASARQPRPKPFLYQWRDAILSERGPEDSMVRLVLCALAQFMDANTTKAWPSQPKIARTAGVSLRTVGTHLADAVKAGWLRRAPRGADRDGYEYTALIPQPENNSAGPASMQGVHACKAQPEQRTPCIPSMQTTARIRARRAPELSSNNSRTKALAGAVSATAAPDNTYKGLRPLLRPRSGKK